MISVTLRQGTLNNSLSMVSMWTYPPTNEQGGQARWGGGGGRRNKTLKYNKERQKVAQTQYAQKFLQL